MPDRKHTTTHAVTKDIPIEITVTDPTENNTWNAPKVTVDWANNPGDIHCALLRVTVHRPNAGIQFNLRDTESNPNPATTNNRGTRRIDDEAYEHAVDTLTRGKQYDHDDDPLHLGITYLLLDTPHYDESKTALLDSASEFAPDLNVSHDSVILSGHESVKLPRPPEAILEECE